MYQLPVKYVSNQLEIPCIIVAFVIKKFKSTSNSSNSLILIVLKSNILEQGKSQILNLLN